MVTVQACDEVGVPTEIRLTDDPSAVVYGKLDPDTSHPFRQTELIDRINGKLHAGARLNTHDMLSIRRAHGITAESHPQFTHEPLWGSPQYSEAFADWVVDQIKQDPDFVWKARETYAGRG